MLVCALDHSREFWKDKTGLAKSVLPLYLFPRRGKCKIKGAKLTIKLDILPHHGSPSLVLLVERNVDRLALDGPSTHVLDEVVKRLVLDAQPRLQAALVDALHALADDDGHANPHELLEALHIGNQVGVKVVVFQRGPELVVLCVVKEGVEGGELLHGFGQRVGGRVGLQRVRGEERQAEAEVWGGEDGQGLDEDVGCRLIAGEVGVELVSVIVEICPR